MWRIQLLSWIKPSYQGAAEVTFNIKQKRSQQDAVDSWPPIIITWHHHERRWIIYLDCIYELIHFTFSAAVVVTLLLTISSILALVDDGVPGTPGRDYPVYDRVPPTLFSCYGKVEAGFYADPQTDCQGSRRKKNVPLKYNDFKGIFSLFQPLLENFKGLVRQKLIHRTNTTPKNIHFDGFLQVFHVCSAGVNSGTLEKVS